MGIFVHCLHMLWQHQIASGYLAVVPLFIGDEIKPDTFATKPGMGDENFCVIHHVK